MEINPDKSSERQRRSNYADLFKRKSGNPPKIERYRRRFKIAGRSSPRTERIIVALRRRTALVLPARQSMSAGYSEKDARDLVRQDLEVSAELMNWSDTYTERIKKGYVTYAQIYVSKRLKAKGFSTRQIADILEISPSTVLDRLKQEQK